MSNVQQYSNSNVGNITFTEFLPNASRNECLHTDEGLRDYHYLAIENMQGADMVPGDAMMSLLVHRVARLWEVCDDGELVGYCSILIQSPDLQERGVHLFNAFVLEDKRWRGYGRAMMQHRVDLFGSMPMAVAIRPNNEPMITLAKRFGFIPGEKRDRWVVWRRDKSGMFTQLEHVIEGKSLCIPGLTHPSDPPLTTGNK